ncbi:4-(cytidine 5'-diphospho)-2-C-methyl-D-erythritol kinase [Xanthobacteraceae bacterium Astr-EGSB]|uniref:4-(cytidine 5'-diphospho)-2-C-methyl-D-erythritol kinase n=1 Tax=Astrobacterium formosum TaxID=3069710 RepID=UPI0027B17920|nr:4-(cytidine 5'-diphospho)-2-C-methyl-D-erythritol kinase [Xanthobacteraceae bacterium Astr-EGSB]
MQSRVTVVSAADTVLTERAPAKINLTLRVLGRRDDGYHDLESLVVFAGEADELALTPGEPLALVVDGPTAAASGDTADNLVLKVTRALAERVPNLLTGRFRLTKRLPVAAGVGGGSSDAAAALRLLARLNGLAPDDARLREAAAPTGADVPVCVDPRARLMRGIGDVLTAPLRLAPLHAVMINPGVPVPTRDVFGKIGLQRGECRGSATPDPGDLDSLDAVLAFMAAADNDLEPPALAIQPVIGEVLAALRARAGCRLARMSGSGATCFGLFAADQQAEAAASVIAAAQPHWWVRATTFG